MKVEKIPVSFIFGGKRYSVEGDKFQRSRETMLRFAIDLPRRMHPNIIVLYEVKKPGQKYSWDCPKVGSARNDTRITAFRF